jgi:hypothetical protein
LAFPGENCDFAPQQNPANFGLTRKKCCLAQIFAKMPKMAQKRKLCCKSQQICLSTFYNLGVVLDTDRLTESDLPNCDEPPAVTSSAATATSDDPGVAETAAI